MEFWKIDKISNIFQLFIIELKIFSNNKIFNRVTRKSVGTSTESRRNNKIE